MTNFTSTRCMHSLDHAHPERQRFLHPEATMPVRTFYGWLFMAASYGAVFAVVALIAAGKLN